MQEEKIDIQEELKACRRSRKDQDGRDFICGCGKKYLSYPALYTHIKTKHDGVQPQGTQKTGTSAPIKRKPKLQQQVLKNILNLLQKKDLNILNQLTSCQGYINPNQRIRKQYLSKQLYQYYIGTMTKLTTFKLNKTTSIQMVLIIFLINIGQYVNQNLFIYFSHFIKIIRNCFYQYGLQVYDCVFKQKNKSIKPFLITQCRYLPIICDFMVRYYIPVDYRDMDTNIMELILYDFCKWMKKQKLTSIQVTLKKCYQLKNLNGLVCKNLPKLNKARTNKNENPDQQQGNNQRSDDDSCSDSQENQEISHDQQKMDQQKDDRVKSSSQQGKQQSEENNHQQYV